MVEQYHLGKISSHSRPLSVSRYQRLTTGSGANIFLAYYHYCNKSVYPFSKDCKDSDLKNLAELDQGSIDFVKYTRNYAEEHSESPTCKTDRWCDTEC